MFRKYGILLTFLTAIFVLRCNGEEMSQDYETAHDEKLKLNTHSQTEGFDMESAIQNVEALGIIANQMVKVQHLISETDAKNFFDYMIQAIDKVQDGFTYTENVYKFIQANGVIRILSNNLINTHTALRTKLLLLLKDIFDLVPTAADNLLPLNIVDRLIDIFENDENLALKAHALDILYKWLPNNLQAQVRVMKISGLETFYKQIDKLDVSVVKTLMELFNKILSEHVEARNNIEHIKDAEIVKMYQNIGFLERMSTPKVCNGLLNIFTILWSYNRNDSDHVKIILDLIVNVKPFCLNLYKKKSKATDLFESLSKYVKDEERKEYFEKIDVNVTQVALVIEDYLKKEDRVLAKDEF